MSKHDGRNDAPGHVDGPNGDAAEVSDPTSEVWAKRLADETRSQREEDDRAWQAVESGAQEGLPPGADLEALRPLDASERARMVDDLLGAARPPAKVVDLGARRRARWIGAASLAVAAAIAAVFLLPSAATLPAYTLTSHSGDRTFRSANDSVEVPIYSQGAMMELVLTPAQPTEAPIEVGAVLVGANEDRVWQPPLQRGRDGAIRIRARIGQDLELAAGEWELWIVIAAEGQLPSNLRSEPPGARRLVHRFQISNDD